MKRSGGVTAVAIVMMLAGVLTGVGALMSLSAGPRALDALDQRMQQLETLPSGTAQGQMSPERVAQLRQRLQEITQELRAVLESPAVRISTFLAALMGIAAFIAGLGVLLLQGWARTLAIFQAGLSIPLGLFAAMYSPQQRLSQAMLRFYEGLVDPATQQHLQQTMALGQTIGQWVGIITLLAWNGFLIWFFSRASVKAQFQQHV